MFHKSRQTLKHSLALELRRLRYGRPEQKVFCIGFQKTGTTSLQYALSLMGYRVAGIFSLKGIETPEDMRDHALELAKKFDAFADNPWPVLFKELDAAFPGSKFILTTRDPDKWFDSAIKHFGQSVTKMRFWLYGASSPRGHEAAYKARLVDHAAEVRAYFEDRPDDFMEFDVAQGDGWEKLCAFLGKPVPKRPFPRLNTAKMRS
ncbi:MAG: sulfotransferase [Henriciella sp.]|nr:sulfotransferase [Henriciella sp.]